MRRLLRCFRLLGHVFVGLVLAAAVQIAGDERLPRERLARWWHRKLLRILHIQVRVHGSPHVGTGLLVCNHVSWLDIPIIGAIQLTRFISKAEVRTWPIAGWLATAAGTFYLQRGAGGTRELLANLAERLSSANITLFPEGTTTEGDRVLRFTSRLFAAAIDGEHKVQPIALRYHLTADGRNIAPFVGDDSLVPHLWRVLREREMGVDITFCPPIDSVARQRGELAELAQAAVAEAIGVEVTRRQKPESLAA